MTLPTDQQQQPRGAADQQRQPIHIPDGSLVEHWTAAGTVRGPLTKREAEGFAEREQVVVADSRPVGLFALAGATMIISAVFAGWFGLSGLVVAIPILLVFGGIGQLLAGMWAFRRGDALTATLWTTFGGFYVTLPLLFWLLDLRPLLSVIGPASVQGTIGLFVVMFSLISFGMGGASLLKNWALAGTLLGLGVAYLFDGLGIWTGPSGWLVGVSGGQSSGTATNWLLILGGYVGMVAALLAIYQAIAIVVNAAAGDELVPLGSARARDR